jgi:hypothetical protein
VRAALSHPAASVADSTGIEFTYLKLCPIVRPNEISPLSIRMLNPHSGFVHTQALYVIGAPSRP